MTPRLRRQDGTLAIKMGTRPTRDESEDYGTKTFAKNKMQECMYEITSARDRALAS